MFLQAYLVIDVESAALFVHGVGVRDNVGVIQQHFGIGVVLVYTPTKKIDVLERFESELLSEYPQVQPWYQWFGGYGSAEIGTGVDVGYTSVLGGVAYALASRVQERHG